MREQGVPPKTGTLGEQHGLAKLIETLEALSTGQSAQQTRDTEIRNQLTTQADAVGKLQACVHRLVLAVAGLAVLVLALGAAVGWQMTHPPEQGYARALGALDATLAQQWSILPKGAQDAFSDTYRRQGLVPPGPRPR